MYRWCGRTNRRCGACTKRPSLVGIYLSSAGVYTLVPCLCIFLVVIPTGPTRFHKEGTIQTRSALWYFIKLVSSAVSGAYTTKKISGLEEFVCRASGVVMDATTEKNKIKLFKVM